MLVRQSVDQSISVFSAITWLIAQNLLQNSWQIECLTKTPTGLLNDQLTSDSQLTMQPDDRPASKISLVSKVYGLVSRLLSLLITDHNDHYSPRLALSGIYLYFSSRVFGALVTLTIFSDSRLKP